MTTDEELQIYGKYLDGTESELDLARLARLTYLKEKLRYRMDIGWQDTQDAVADITKMALMGMAINSGIVTDEAVITRYNAHVSELLDGYGGPEKIIDTLETNQEQIQHFVFDGYYAACEEIKACEDPEKIMHIDFSWEPKIEEV